MSDRTGSLFRLGQHRRDHARSSAGQCAEHAADRCAAGGAREGEGRRGGTRGHRRQRAQGVLRRARSRHRQRQAGDRDQGVSRTAVFRAQRHPVPDGQADHRGDRRRGARRRHDDRDLLRHDHCRRRLDLRLSRDRCRPDPGACISCNCRGWSASTRRLVRCFWASRSMPRPRSAWGCSARSCPREPRSTAPARSRGGLRQNRRS